MFNNIVYFFKEGIKPFTKLDYLLYFVVLIGCFFIFQQYSDLTFTTISSSSYFKGHVLDFYEYNKQFHHLYIAYYDDFGSTVTHYMPSTYIFFAILNLPFYLFGIAPDHVTGITPLLLFYNKSMTLIVYFLSTYIFYKIGITAGLDRKKTYIMVIIFITAPIGFFSQIIYGQYDILTVFFMLLGLLSFYKGDKYKYLIYFSIAITFKYHALLFLIPLMLIREKNIFRLAINSLIAVAPLMFYSILYYGSDAFIQDVLHYEGANIFGWLTYFSLILLYLYAYFKNFKKEEVLEWSVFYLTGVVFIVFGLSSWSPQWLLMAMPILALGTVISKHIKKLLVIDIFMMLFYTGHTTLLFPKNVDQDMLNQGIFRSFMPENLNLYLPIGGHIYPFYHMYFYVALFTICLFLHFFLKAPIFRFNYVNEDISGSANHIRLRFIFGLLCFIIPVIISFSAAKYFS